MLKTKATETTVANDRQMYEQSYLNAFAIHGKTEIDINIELAKMSTEKLNELYNYIKHDKTTSNKKAEKLCEFFEVYDALEKTQHKINSAMDRIQTLTVTALENDEGVFDMKALLESVSNQIAINNAELMPVD